MKARNENGTIVKYRNLPNEFTKSDGSVMLNFANADTAALEAEGFYDVHRPTFNENTQELGDIEWDSANSRFTYPVSNKTFSQSLADMKAQKIKNLKAIYNSQLAETDWYVTRKQEKNTAIPSAITTKRDNLRSECATKEAEINAKTTKAQVANYTLPSFI